MSILKELQAFGRIVIGAFFIVGLLSCTGSDLGDGLASGGGTTTISGKVSLPAALANKPGYKAEMLAKMPRGKPGSADFKPSLKPVAGEASAVLPAMAATLISAPVELYDATHPEWFHPVAVATTDSAGSYTLSALSNAAANGGGYVDGDPIPAGFYTLLSKKVDPVTNEMQVAIQTVVKSFAGAITGSDLIAQPSDATPKILSIQGARKNRDGSNTWGKQTTIDGNGVVKIGAPEVATNSAVQVAFSMAMSRESIMNGGISVACDNVAVDGKWTISADWTTATFYPAQNLTADKDCTVTVNGSDTSESPVRNVYENAQPVTGYGYFRVTSTIDTVKPTGIILTPDAVDASPTTSVRIIANELLDINTVRLSSYPSLGDHPRAAYIGKIENTNSQYKYVYEFVPSSALKLDTDYDIVIAGAKDLSGNVMSTLNYSFGTSASAPGVTSTDPDVQAVQLSALGVFGKWIRAINEQNIGTMQMVMSGNFIYEYDQMGQINQGMEGGGNVGGLNENDDNRDGRLSLGEYSEMLEKNFLLWAYCGATMSGSIVNSINVDMVSETADFSFTLTASPTLTSQQCRDASPKQKLYLTLKKQNAAWVIVRASEGIDTRDKALVVYDYIPTIQPADGDVLGAIPNPTTPLTFGWNDPVSMTEGQPAKMVASYVFVIWNEHTPWSGRAYAIDPDAISTGLLDTIYEFGYPYDPALPPTGVTDISTLFGFDTYSYGGYDGWNGTSSYWQTLFSGPGERLEWSVLGLGSKKETDFSSNSVSSADLLRDIVASSKAATYQNPGVRPHISADIKVNNVSLTYSEFLWGYNAGSYGKVTLKLTSTNANPSWDVWVYGNSGSKSYNSASTPGVVNGTVEIDLYKGINWVYISDGTGLYHWFSIATTGGIPPVISIYTVNSDNGLYISPDAWGNVSVLGATKVTIMGEVSDGSTYVDLNLWSNLGASEYRRIPVTGGFFTTDIYEDPNNAAATLKKQLNIYKGDNWISLYSQNWAWSSVGVYTDTGSAYTPPITVVIPEAEIMENNGNSTSWDASAVNDNNVLVSGVMSNYASAGFSTYFSLYSNAGYQSGTVSVNASNGKYTLPVDLYNGWNYLYLSDGLNGWHSASIYTSKGKVAVPLQIKTVNNVTPPYQGAQMTVSGCTATIKGIAKPGSYLNSYWYGYDGLSSYYEYPPVQVPWVPTVDLNGDGVADASEFSLTVPVLSTAPGYGYSYNYLDIYDDQWRWAGVSLVTNSTNCSYVYPVNTVTNTLGILSTGNTVLPTLSWSYLDFWSGTSYPDVTHLQLDGNHTRSDQPITVTLYDHCGTTHTQGVSSVAGNWSFSGPSAIQLYKGYNDLYINDGYSTNYYYTYFDPTETTSSRPAPESRMGVKITAPTGLTPNYTSCSYSEWDAGAATTITIEATLLSGLSSSGTLYTNSSSYPLEFVNGVAVATVDIYNGYNYIDIYDGNSTWGSLYVISSNGVSMPKPLGIISLNHGDTVPTGVPVTISGKWDTNWYNPDYLYASVGECDANWSCNYSSFSNDGYSTAFDSLNSTTGDFSFTATLTMPTAVYTEIYVYGSNNTTGEGHAHSIYVNTNLYGYSEWWYKPSAGGAKVDVANSRPAKAMQRNRTMRMLQSRKAAQVKGLAKPNR